MKFETWLAITKIQAAMAVAPPEPIGEWMREQGFPPERSLLVLPESLRSEIGGFPPRYVRFSTVVAQPVLMRDTLADLRWSS